MILLSTAAAEGVDLVCRAWQTAYNPEKLLIKGHFKQAGGGKGAAGSEVAVATGHKQAAGAKARAGAAEDTISWDNYEELSRTLLERIAEHAPVTTTRLEPKVSLRGRATANEVDIVWEFRDAIGQHLRVVFECRSYSKPITQQALHSWRSVIDDIAADGVPTIGVMVTRTGYQAGARRVAEPMESSSSSFGHRQHATSRNASRC